MKVSLVSTISVVLRASCVLVLCLLATPSAAQKNNSTKPLPTLEEVRAGLEETLLTIDSLAVDFEVTYKRSKETPAWSIIPKEPIKWSWYKSGKQELIEEHPHEVPSENAVMQSRVAIDGGKVSVAHFARNTPGEIIGITNSRRTPDFYHRMSPANYLGLRLHGKSASVFELLGSDESRIVGRESIQEEKCLHVDCGALEYSPDLSIHYEVWLIPERGFLPKKILGTFRVKTPQGEWRTVKNNQTIEKFMQVEDPILGRSRSFPQICVSRESGATMTMKVTACAINQKISPANLEVTPQTGTEITTVEPGKEPKREIYGGGKALEVIRREAISKGELLANRPMADARPSSKPEWTRTIAWSLAGLFLVSTLSIVYWRR